MDDLRDELQQVLGSAYLIERELGRGGMATVYLARDVRHARWVAVKVLRPELAHSLGSERFLREIGLAARLQHPHVVPLFDSGGTGSHEADDRLLYFVMPYVEGESLRQRVERERRLPVDEAVQITREVAEALDYAHAQGVVHRDVKPENVLLSRGHALVADFGVARAVSMATEPSAGETLTQAGLALGTPTYMSPEQITGERDVDRRSDVYSLGCVLYEMLAGEPPFTAPTLAAVLARRFVEPAPQVARAREGVPAHVAAAVARALERDPAHRFATAGELAAALAQPARAGDEPMGDRSLAVLPFDNLSPDPDNAYFADGLTEELIADLSKVGALKVISRTSVLQYRATTKAVPVIARELGVRYILEGSVRRAGSSLRVTAQLIDAASDAHVWAEKYAGTLEDVFDLQERLSRQIVDALRVTLTPDDDRRLGARAISDVRAFECYLRARQLQWSGTAEALDLALHLTREALGIVGENAVLRALQGTLHFQYVNFGISWDPAHLEAAERCARAAVALAPEAAAGHLLFGMIAYKQARMAQATRYLRRALEVEPAHADSLAWAAYLRLQTGQVALARAMAVRLLDVDPFNSQNHMLRGLIEYHEGAPERASPHVDRALELDPHNALAHYIRAEALAAAGRSPEAMAGLRALQEIGPGAGLATLAAFLQRAVAGDRVGAAVAVEECRAHALEDEQFSLGVALGFTLLGEREPALDWLENAVRRGFVSYPFLAESGPFARPLHGEPRFEALLDRVRREWEAFDS